MLIYYNKPSLKTLKMGIDFREVFYCKIQYVASMSRDGFIYIYDNEFIRS